MRHIVYLSPVQTQVPGNGIKRRVMFEVCDARRLRLVHYAGRAQCRNTDRLVFIDDWLTQLKSINYEALNENKYGVPIKLKAL